MVKMLAQAQMQMTLTNPITLHTLAIDAVKPETIESVDPVALTANAFKRFNATFKGGYGPVHVAPRFWTDVFVATLVKARETDAHAKTMDVPNGCCNVDTCPVKLYYTILLESIRE